MTLYLKNVPVQRFGKKTKLILISSNELCLEPGYHMFATSVLPYEQCLSVLNLVLNRTNDSEIILKSKERLIFHIGNRRFASAPIYSQHSNGDKHKVCISISMFRFHLFFLFFKVRKILPSSSNSGGDMFRSDKLSSVECSCFQRICRWSTRISCNWFTSFGESRSNRFETNRSQWTSI